MGLRQIFPMHTNITRTRPILSRIPPGSVVLGNFVKRSGKLAENLVVRKSYRQRVEAVVTPYVDEAVALKEKRVHPLPQNDVNDIRCREFDLV